MIRLRGAFTLIEMMVSISILSIMMIFLYKSYASLNRSNLVYKNEVKHIKLQSLKKKVIYLDFALAIPFSNRGNKPLSIHILPQNSKEDVVLFQTSNSIHNRFNPYIAYIVKDKILYRLESLREFKEFPLNINSDFVVDDLGEVNSFRVYKSKKGAKTIASEFYLVHIDFKSGENILLKIKVLNG